MTQSDKDTLKWLLVDAKAIVNIDDSNPYTGIFLNNLCEVVDEFIEIWKDRRKDALLEWLEYEREWFEGTDIEPHYQKVIDKLKSM